MANRIAAVDDLPVRPSGRILRAAEAQAWQDGYNFLEVAKREAAQLRESARLAYASRYAQGYQDGKAAGEAEAARLVSEATVKVDRYLGTLRKDIIEVAIDVVRRVLGEFDVAELVAKAASQAVAELRRARHVKISVHPSAAANVQRELETMLRDSALGLTFEVHTDARLAPGACVLSTDIAIVDASVDAQLRALAAALAKDGEARP